MAVNTREVPVNGKKWVTLYFAWMSEHADSEEWLYYLLRFDVLTAVLYLEIVVWVVPKILKDRSALGMSGTSRQMTQHHVPEDLNPKYCLIWIHAVLYFHQLKRAFDLHLHIFQ
jgi:hypothetical protein